MKNAALTPGSFSDENGTQLLLVGPDVLHRCWPTAIDLLETGREHWEDYYDVEHILAEIISQRKQLWLVNDADNFFAAVFTHIATFPKCRVCGIDLFVGLEMKRALPLLMYIEEWAWQQGARFVELEGRKAWLRLLIQYGYESQGMRARKDLRKRSMN